MPSLCSNRYPLPGSPSTCTLDTALMPIPTWVLFLTLPYYAILYRRARNATPRPTPIRSRLGKVVHVLYIVLLVAAVAMSVLEMARLSAAALGVGLLPFNLVGLVTAIIVVWMRHKLHGSTFPLVHYWILFLIFESLKLSRLQLLQQDNPATASKYPSSDQVIDNETSLGLYAFFLLADLYEIWTYGKDWRRERPSDMYMEGNAVSTKEEGAP